MNSRLFPLLLVAGLAGAGGWFARSWKSSPSPTSAHRSTERKILYYQSSMHPWIKSDQPGKCTICGMDLAPVFEGDTGFTASSDLVTLNSNSITVAHVQTVPAVRKPLVRTVRLAGTIDDDDSRHRVLSAYAEGRLDRLFVNYIGAEVKAGQPLALLYSPTLLAAVREYLALPESSSAGAGLIKSSAASRLLQLGLLPEQIEKLPATFGETNLHVEILSPMSGTVVGRDIYEGQTVTAGQPLFELADFETMWVQLQAYEDELPWLRPGQNVEITSPSLPGYTLTNVLKFIDPNFNVETRTTRIRVELPNPLIDTPNGPQRLIRHRIFGTARVRTETAETLTVPRSAVLDAGQPLAYVELSNGNYQPRKLILGKRGDVDVEVLSGISEGERVVSQGALLLDGQAQLNMMSHPAEPPATDSPVAALPQEPLTPTQLQALKLYLTRADSIRESLSSDSLAQFNEQASQMHAASAELNRLFAGAGTWQERIGVLFRQSHLDPAPDLASARKEFHPLSESLVDLGRALRNLPEFAGLKLYECPMTRRSFPGAPTRAAWLQLGGPIRNPYFGAAMIDCGTEVRP